MSDMRTTVEQKAWNLAIDFWIAGAVLIYILHHLIGEVGSRDVRWWLDAGLYVVAFFYILMLGPLHDFFLRRLDAKTPKA